jgi:hypothetical protein
MHRDTLRKTVLVAILGEHHLHGTLNCLNGTLHKLAHINAAHNPEIELRGNIRGVRGSGKGKGLHFIFITMTTTNENGQSILLDKYNDTGRDILQLY